MCEKELLVSFLYDDLGDADRGRFEGHLRDCAECRNELKALRGVRADLISWSPPQPDFGFRIVREPKVLNDGREPKVATVVPMTPRTALRGWWTPAAGLAAAATLVLAAAAGLARFEVRSGPDGFTVRTGWSASDAVNERGYADTASRSHSSRGDIVLPASAPVMAD